MKITETSYCNFPHWQKLWITKNYQKNKDLFVQKHHFVYNQSNTRWNSIRKFIPIFLEILAKDKGLLLLCHKVDSFN